MRVRSPNQPVQTTGTNAAVLPKDHLPRWHLGLPENGRRGSEREPADSLRDKFDVIGGWLPSLITIVRCHISHCNPQHEIQQTTSRVGNGDFMRPEHIEELREERKSDARYLKRVLPKGPERGPPSPRSAHLLRMRRFSGRS